MKFHPFKADQASFNRAVKCSRWLESTMLHTSQQSTEIILIILSSILPLVVHGCRRVIWVEKVTRWM